MAKADETLFTYNSDTGEMKVFSQHDPDVSITIRHVEFQESNDIHQSIRQFERAARCDAISKVEDSLQDIRLNKL